MKKRILLYIISFFVSSSTFAQVTGTVVDASTKEPLIGAVIISTANPFIGTVAGIDGSFSINLKVGDEVSVSFVGYEGQPVNDMENGWVYWSNWQGLTDVASGIQLQRGLGASRLAVPSVGGTVSIFTKSPRIS